MPKRKKSRTERAGPEAVPTEQRGGENMFSCGVWVWNLPPMGQQHNRLAYFREIASVGFAHVLVKILDGSRAYNGDNVVPAFQTAKSEGLHAWAWGYECPDQKGFAALGARATQVGADGVVVDAEKEWASRVDDVLPCMAALRVEWAGPIYVSCYPSRESFPDFPWDQFAESSDGWMPQVYEAHPTIADSCARAASEFSGKGLYLAGPAHPELGPASNTAEFLDWCRAQNLPCNLWSWDGITDEMKALVQAATQPAPAVALNPF